MTMTKPCNPEIQARLEAYILEVGSQEKAAKEIRYSAGTLSQYRKGIYNGDITTLEARLNEMFTVQAEAQNFSVDVPDYVGTSVSEKVYATIRLCHLKGGFAIECGDAGIGKTKAAQKYLHDYPSSAVYISVNPCFASTTAFLKRLCQAFHLPTGRKDDMWVALFDYLQGGKKVLIIDEAQHLTAKTIESIRGWFDENPDLGIIFIGNVETVTNRRSKGNVSFAQINNRTKLTEIRRTTHIKLNDLRLLCPMLGSCEKELQLLHVVAQSEQGIRGAMNLYSNARDNENVGYDGLLSTAKAMKILPGGIM